MFSLVNNQLLQNCIKYPRYPYHNIIKYVQFREIVHNEIDKVM